MERIRSREQREDKYENQKRDLGMDQRGSIRERG
jgi:hypothetical protein